MGYELGQQSNQLKSFDLTIDGTKITNSQLLNLTLNWNINNFKVVGELMFRDMSNLVEHMPIRGNNTVAVAMTDYDDEVSKQEFKVTDVQYSRVDSGEPVVKLLLCDPITLSAMQMYNEMSWDKADMIEIIDHPETLKPLLTGKKKDFCPPLPKHKNFCMPLHVPFSNVYQWLARNNNVFFYQTRKDFVIQPIKKLFSRGKKGDKFYYKAPNNFYRRKIYESVSHFGKVIEANAFQPNAKIASFVPGSKHAKWEKNDFKKALGDISSKGKTDADLPGTTDKHYYKSDYHIKEVVDYMWQKNAYQDLELEILVPGQFATNIGDIVELDIVNYTETTEPEYNINGEWLIVEITDKILGTDFIQTLRLTRAKFSK